MCREFSKNRSNPRWLYLVYRRNLRKTDHFYMFDRCQCSCASCRLYNFDNEYEHHYISQCWVWSDPLIVKHMLYADSDEEIN